MMTDEYRRQLQRHMRRLETARDAQTVRRALIGIVKVLQDTHCTQLLPADLVVLVGDVVRRLVDPAA